MSSTSNVHPLLQVIPLAVLFGLMIGYKDRRLHPVLAGFVGAFVAIALAGFTIPISDIGTQFYSGVNGIMFSSVMLYAATALFLSEIGSTKSFIGLVAKLLGPRNLWLLPGVLIFLLGTVVYVAGHGAANILVIGPIIYSIAGWIPEIVAATGIAASASWTTSPASAETGVTAKTAGITPELYSGFMRPYTLIMWIIATLLAFYGLLKHRAKLSTTPSITVLSETSVKEDAIKATPFVAFLLLIFIGPLFKIHAVAILLVVMLLAYVLVARKDFNAHTQKWVEANRPLLTYLFYAGCFLGFINVIGLIGTFNTLAGLVAQVPVHIAIPTAIIIGYIIGMVAGAYTAMVMGLIHPILVAAGIPWQALGFVNYAIGLGAMTCPAQVSVSASSLVYKADIPTVVRNNLKYMPFLLIIPIVMAILTIGL